MLLALSLSTGCKSRETEFLDSFGPAETEYENSAGDSEEEAEVPEQDEEDTEETALTIFVDVCGAVVNPGVYELAADSRVFQAIEAAGGFLPEAAGEYLNRAKGLEDGQQIYVPTREEAVADQSLISPLEQTLASAKDENGGDAAESSSSGKINLNTADEAALTTLTGIGASKAQAILAYREENGGFSAIEEILNVPGIKEGTFVKIKDYIAVE